MDFLISIKFSGTYKCYKSRTSQLGKFRRLAIIRVYGGISRISHGLISAACIFVFLFVLVQVMLELKVIAFYPAFYPLKIQSSGSCAAPHTVQPTKESVMKIINISALAMLLAFAATWTNADDSSKGFRTYPNIVAYEFVKEQASIPRREGVVVIDSRPARKFGKGHIPVAINISDTLFDSYLELLPEDKSNLLIFYCGGLTCPLSHKSAYKAESLGYTNIRVYAAGYPDWAANGGLPGISAKYVKKVLGNDKALVIDARPPRKFKKGHVPGSVNIPTTRFDEHKSSLPEDKGHELIFYCGGYHCPLSPKGADRARALGYSNVKLFQSGYPAWQEAFGQKKLSIQESGEEGVISIDSFMDVLKNHPDEVYLVDVRDQAEVDMDGTFASAKVIPIDTLLPQIPDMPNHKPTIFFCANGARAGEAYDFVNMKRNDMKAYFLEANVAFKKQTLPVVTPVE